MNLDIYEIVKCVEEIIGKDNLISDPNITKNNILIKVKKSSQIDISQYEKQIADCVKNFVNSPFGVIITES